MSAPASAQPRPGPRFRVETTAALLRHGLRGAQVIVALTKDEIRLTGTEGGDHAIPVARVAQLRVGLFRRRGATIPELLLFLRDPRETLRLNALPDPADPVAYRRGDAEFVRSLAARLYATRGRRSIEIGQKYPSWLVAAILLLGIPAATAVLVLAQTLSTPLSDVVAAVAGPVTGVVMLGVTGFIIWWSWRHSPRSVSTLSDLDRVLPQR